MIVAEHKAGGLRESKCKLGRSFAVPEAWEFPEYIDGRPYLLPADDQGRTSECAAYSTAGIEESLNWFKTGKRVSIDPHPLYLRAKELDGEPGEDTGTTLDSILKAARLMGYFERVNAYDINNDVDLRYALHKFPMALVGLKIHDGWNKTPSDGRVPNGTRFLGGHALIACYYDRDGVEGVNSWGIRWGRNGFWRLTWKQYAEQFMDAKGFAFIQ